MHELAICQALISQVEAIAKKNKAEAVIAITLKIGPLSGAEASLIERAYPLAAAGTVAEGATLTLETMPVRVRCHVCDAETEVSTNRLLCGECGSYRTELMGGNEMLLTHVELDRKNSL